MPVSPPAPRGRRGTIPARQRRSRETEAQLLRAAEREFRRAGIQGATVAAICAAAGVGVGTFYGRFDDKEALVAAFFVAHYGRAVARLEREFPIAGWTGRSVTELVDAWIGRRVTRFRRDRPLTRAVLGYARANPSPAFRAAAAEYSAAVVDRFAALLACARGGARHPAPRRAAVIAVSTVESLLKELALYGDVRSPALAIGDDELVPELTRLVSGYLGAGPEKGKR